MLSIGHVVWFVDRSDLQSLVSRDQLACEGMLTEDSDTELTCGAHDLDGQSDECSTKALPLPARDLLSERHLGDPLAQVPGESGDLEPSRVASHLRDGHAPRGDTRPESGDEVLLITSFVRLVDDVFSSPATRQIGDDVAKAVSVP